MQQWMQVAPAQTTEVSMMVEDLDKDLDQLDGHNQSDTGSLEKRIPETVPEKEEEGELHTDDGSTNL